MNFPIPFEKTQRCVSLAMAEVFKKKAAGKRLAALPYASAFFRLYFGTGTPNRQTLMELNCSAYTTIPEIKAQLDRLIETNGSVYSPLENNFIHRAFPSLAGLDRFDAHFELKNTQRNNVEAKLQEKHAQELNRYQCEVLELDGNKLSEWVSDTTGILTDLEQTSILSEWYSSKSPDAQEYSFRDLYYGMNAAAISLDIGLA
jgi:hypothetical protein